MMYNLFFFISFFCLKVGPVPIALYWPAATATYRGLIKPLIALNVHEHPLH